jgi:hypothetical protein
MFLREVVGTCPYCKSTITRTTPRALDGDQRVTCLACVDVIEGSCPFCDRDVTRRHLREASGTGVAHAQCAQDEERRRRSR